MSSFWDVVSATAAKTVKQLAKTTTAQKVDQIAENDAVYAKISSQVYSDQRENVIGQYTLEKSTAESVFYVSDDHVIIGFRGSVTDEDWNSTDKSILTGELASTERFKRTKKECTLYLEGSKRITFTGHSLGGSIAVVFALQSYGNAVVFNAGYPPYGWPCLVGFSTLPIHSYTTDRDMVSVYGVGNYQKNTILRTDDTLTMQSVHGINIFQRLKRLEF